MALPAKRARISGGVARESAWLRGVPGAGLEAVEAEVARGSSSPRFGDGASPDVFADGVIVAVPGGEGCVDAAVVAGLSCCARHERRLSSPSPDPVPVADAERFRLRAIGEHMQQVGQLGVAVLLRSGRRRCSGPAGGRRSSHSIERVGVRKSERVWAWSRMLRMLTRAFSLARGAWWGFFRGARLEGGGQGFRGRFAFLGGGFERRGAEAGQDLFLGGGQCGSLPNRRRCPSSA